MNLSRLFNDFVNSERTGGLILIFCTVISLIVANSSFGESYLHLWHVEVGYKPIEFWINDGLMTVFFLLVGLEIERELYIGELADIRKSMLPIIAAAGGMLVPALIHFAFNHGEITQNGYGIPMATDIAFSLAVLSMLGTRVPPALKVFLTALAIIDDLGAILVIAIFYSEGFSLPDFSVAIGIFAVLFVLNRLRIYFIWIYLLLGIIMWFFMYRSGIHATITGVLLAFTIPFGKGDETSVSYKLQQFLHVPVAFIILPLFALVNTALIIPSTVIKDIFSENSLGIISGLLFGKPAGVFLFSTLGIWFGICGLPVGIKKRHLLFTGFLAGIGFTMSMFIALLAFKNAEHIDASRIAIIVGSVLAAVAGFIGLKLTLPLVKPDYQNDSATMK